MSIANAWHCSVTCCGTGSFFYRATVLYSTKIASQKMEKECQALQYHRALPQHLLHMQCTSQLSHETLPSLWRFLYGKTSEKENNDKMCKLSFGL
jgi:hypothetical protein